LAQIECVICTLGILSNVVDNGQNINETLWTNYSLKKYMLRKNTTIPFKNVNKLF